MRIWPSVRSIVVIAVWGMTFCFLFGCSDSGTREKENVKEAVHELKDVSLDVAQIFEDRELQDYAELAVEPFADLLRDKSASKVVRLRAGEMLRHLKRPSSVPTLLIFTRDDDPDFRKVAVKALAAMGGQDAIRAFIDLVHDHDLAVRATTLRLMGSVGDKQVLPYLMDALGASEKDIRAAAAIGLIGLGELALQAVMEATEHGSGITQIEASKVRVGLCEGFRIGLAGNDRVVRRAMVGHLGQLHYKDAIPDLINGRFIKEKNEYGGGLTDRDPEVRLAAAHALGEMMALGAREKLSERMNDRKEGLGVRLAAAVALGKMGESGAWDYLIEQLDAVDAEQRIKATHALGQVGIPAIAALSQCLSADSAKKRSSAARALGEMESESVVDLLVIALRDPVVDVRVAAVAALGRLGLEVAVKDLLTLLNDSDEKVRHHVALVLERYGSSVCSQLNRELTIVLQKGRNSEAVELARLLGRIGDGSSAEALRSGLLSESASVRLACAWALGEIQHCVVVPGLVAALDDVDLSVCREAAVALGKISNGSARPALVRCLEVTLKGPQIGDMALSLRSACEVAISQIDGNISDERNKSTN